MHIFRSYIKLYQELSKSGIVFLVLISVLSGYLLGTEPSFGVDGLRLCNTLLGILFLSAGASALNQYQESHLDARMQRTATRPLPSARIKPIQALYFIGVTLSLGLLILYYLDLSVFLLGISAIFFYNVLYTLWWKKKWPFAAIPGAIPGALPILMGYMASKNPFWTKEGLYLFFLLFFWQMPHFWVLALRYEKDYAQGGFPTLPVIWGSKTTMNHIVVWSLAYIGWAMAGPLFLPIGWIYLLCALVTSMKLLFELFYFFFRPLEKSWLPFFLWVNFSLIFYLCFALLDHWSPFFQRNLFY